MTTTEWMLQRNCADADTNLFFPTRGGNDRGSEAKLICAGCPVTNDCLEYALGDSSILDGRRLVGIFGGTDANERDLILRSRRRGICRERGCDRPVDLLHAQQCRGCYQRLRRDELGRWAAHHKTEASTS